MHRIDDPSAVPTLPAPRPQGTPGYFSGGSPGSGGFAATVVRHEWMNAVQEELVAVIAAAGIPLDKTSNTQLLAALRSLMASGVQVFSVSGTFTVPPGVTSVSVELWGGGAGSSGGIGAGGAGGGYSWKRIAGLTPGATVAVTVGPGGVAGNNGAGATAGGTTSFGAYFSATGGSPGNAGAGPGGNGIGGDLNISGGGSQDIDAIATYSLGTLGCALGGAAPRGGLPGTFNSGAVQIAPTAPGGGGSANAANPVGQAGAAGMVVVYW